MPAGRATSMRSRCSRAAPAEAPWRRSLTPDPVLLFRYSALTFNPHRIHYDAPYAAGVEGYPGLVVHGPLIATLMVDLCRRSRPEARITGFSFRAMAPLFCGNELVLGGAPSDDGARAQVWAANHEGGLASQGEVTFG
jgi:3-methylfumaryl-CoA hydratase